MKAAKVLPIINNRENNNSKQLALVISLLNKVFKQDLQFEDDVRLHLLDRINYLNGYLSISENDFLILLRTEIVNMGLENLNEFKRLNALLSTFKGIEEYLNKKIGGSNENILN